MTTVTDTDPHVSPEGGHTAEHADHPSEKQYWKIFFLLFAVTAVEVGLYYFSIPGVNINNAVLGGLAIVKFFVVVSYFMHLKFDNRILRRLFVGGIVLAIFVYIAYLLTMGVFIEPPAERNGGSMTRTG
jgi:cytochrome c oxidase subunit 4